jgi:thiamine biosynthesis protein ThiS
MITINSREKVEWKENLTIRDLLQRPGNRYSLVAVTVNSTLVPLESYDTYVIPDDAQVWMVPIAGGG